MGSALLDNSAAQSTPDAASALRRQAAERLAAHRSRRVAAHPADSPIPSAAPRNTRSARIAAAVAERYAHTPTYRDFLAAEAERAVRQAHAAAEVAALHAQAIAAAQQDLLRSLTEELATPETEAVASHPQPESSATPSLWPDLEPATPHSPTEHTRANPRKFSPPSRAKQAQPRHAAAKSTAALADLSPAPDPSRSAHALAAGLTIRLYQDESGATRVSLDPPAAPPAFAHPHREVDSLHSDEEARLLDEEIAFRHEPVFEESAGPPCPLPANLIEFPRQLVAARKARPRLAEGPLREEAEDAPGAGQLRIFEVDTAQIATAPESAAADTAATFAQWTTIWLDSPSQPGLSAVIEGPEELASPLSASRSTQGLPDIASVRRRLLSGAINGAILIAAFAVFAVVSLWIAGHLPLHGAASLSVGAEAATFLNRAAIQAALPFAVCAFALLAAIYQALFFSLSTATPGMRAARIALCTFSEENPARSAVRRRLLALLLSAAPVGLGFLWAALDEERLSWHDRICGIYQRSY